MLIAYVSCAVLPEPDIDQEPLVEGLEAAGHGVEVVAWDDPSVRWSRYDAALIRATWNYPNAPGAFAGWIERAGGQTRLLNSPEVLRWNMHKSYLRELEGAGVAVVPSAYFQRGDEADLDALCGERGWEKVVIKPCIGCGSKGTRVFVLDEEGEGARVYLDRSLGERDMMVQRFMEQVAREGETSLIVIDGELTHAIEKKPRFHGQDESVALREGGPSDEQRALADKVLSAAGREYLYARVDVIPADDGGLMLSELEMLEPSLYFPQNPAAVGVLVRGLEKRLKATSY